MARPIEVLRLTDSEKSELHRRVNAASTSKRDSLRAEINLLRAKGAKQTRIAKKLKVCVATVNKWSRRFKLRGLAGLNELPGRGRKDSLSLDKVETVVTKVTKPPHGRTRWSTRTMAGHVGMSHSSVSRIWNRNDLKPHLTKTFKISKDPQFYEKFWDVIGLYLNPPDKAIVLCCDEKSQCQALERTQPGLPLGIGHIRTKTHDYKRHGTVTLFAALNYLDGKLISRYDEKHTHVEWLRFLKQINRETPRDMALHLIVDNYCTHKDKKVKEWAAKHPRFHFHFTPTGSSWLNLVERFFSDITQDVVRDGSFSSVNELVNDMERYLCERNMNPKPYRWKAKGEDILRKIRNAKDVLDGKIK
jgi:transposase